MKFAVSSAAVAALAVNVAAQSVSGAAEGFAAGITGGGSAEVVTPTTNEELVSYLGDSSPRVILLSKTFDFTGSSVSGSGCAPWGTGAGCQTAINKDDWCGNYQPDAPSTSVTYDEAGLDPIMVASDKTIIGSGSEGVIKGKGIRLANGIKNVIIQNIHITELNPQYVWGGDAITLAGTDMIWIDHVKTSQIGRQHIVLGEDASGRVTISNSEIDGTSDWSATCDGHQYWALYFTGSQDQITFKGNYVHGTSGRAPKVAGNTLLHAVNNYWEDNTGHAFEIPPAPRFWLKATRFPASRRRSRMLPPVEACSPSTTAPPLLLASSTLAALALSTLSATLAISLVLPTRASCLTFGVEAASADEASAATIKGGAGVGKI